jgi:hypothetical protein
MRIKNRRCDGAKSRWILRVAVEMKKSEWSERGEPETGARRSAAAPPSEHKPLTLFRQFLEWFPGVSREQALAVLEFARASLVTA